MKIEKKDAVGYSRLSQEDRDRSKEELETSLINQRKDIEDYCKKHNLNLIKTYEDKYMSGSDWNRPQFNLMLEDAFNHKFKVVVVKDLSRLSRDSALQKRTLTDFKNLGIELVSLMGGVGSLIEESTYGFVNELAIAQGRENTKRLHERKMKEGLPFTNAPYGYKYNKKGEWKVVDDKAQIVREIFNLKISNLPTDEIAKKVNLSVWLVWRILHNKNYLGFCSYKKQIKDYQGKVIRTEEIIYKGKHEPIIDQEIWLKLYPKDKKLFENEDIISKNSQTQDNEN